MNTNITNSVCPACGYCPHCGRGGFHFQPYPQPGTQPWGGWWGVYPPPYWYGNTGGITISAGTGNAVPSNTTNCLTPNITYTVQQ